MSIPGPHDVDASNSQDFPRSAERLTRPETSPLITTANNLAIPGQSGGKPNKSDVRHKQGSRVERWAARQFLWHESQLNRVRGCGRWSVRADDSVQVRAKNGVAGFGGLATCGSIWACPLCNARIQAVRRLEVSLVPAVVEARGGGAAFGALTLRHHQQSPLDLTWRNLSKCNEAVTQDRATGALRQRFGWIGTVRAAEVTHGANGWHPHLHPLMLFDRPVDRSMIEDLHEAQAGAWARKADRLGLEAPLHKAQYLTPVRLGSAEPLGRYFAKSVYRKSENVQWEMTASRTKSRTRAEGSRTPWEILDSARLDGDADDLALWHTWEKGSKAKRSMTWAKGLRADLQLDSERTDEEIAAEEVGSWLDIGFVITDWKPVTHRARIGAELLNVINGGKTGKPAENSVPSTTYPSENPLRPNTAENSSELTANGIL